MQGYCIVGRKVGIKVGAVVGKAVPPHSKSTVIKKSPMICHVLAEKTCQSLSVGGLFRSLFAVIDSTSGETI